VFKICVSWEGISISVYTFSLHDAGACMFRYCFPIYINFYLVLLSLYRHSFTLSAHACERTTVRPTIGFQRRDMLQHIHLHSDRLRSVLIYA